MMMSQFGVKYALHIITSNFGNFVTKVCENLLKRGPLTLRQLVGYTELSPQQVKNSLLILIQHNCVQAFSAEQSEGPKVTQYMALFDNILHRFRFGKFMAIVSHELDKDCELIIKDLLENGRLTHKQIVEGALSTKSQDSAAKDSVEQSFLRLLNTHFIELCPAPEPVLEEASKEEAPAKKRGAKSGKIVEVPKTIEQRVLEAAVPAEAIRFSIMMDFETGAHKQESENDSSGMPVGEKRKHDALDFDAEFGSKKEVVLWRANFEEFIRCLRHKACIESVRERLDDVAALVLKAMLKATRTLEKKVKADNSVPSSISNIYQEVINSEAGRSLTMDRVEASLSELCGRDIVENESYSVDLRKILEMAQNNEAESIVLQRHGRDAYIIFRLLSTSGISLETDKISDIAFVEKKDAPKILYTLWKDEYVHMEKLAIAGARQLQLLVWKVDRSIVWRHVLDEMFHAALNLSLRQAYEEEQNKEIRNLPAHKRVGDVGKQFERFKNTIFVLQSSLLKIDDAIMLFHDF